MVKCNVPGDENIQENGHSNHNSTQFSYLLKKKKEKMITTIYMVINGFNIKKMPWMTIYELRYLKYVINLFLFQTSFSIGKILNRINYISIIYQAYFSISIISR